MDPTQPTDPRHATVHPPTLLDTTQPSPPSGPPPPTSPHPPPPPLANTADGEQPIVAPVPEHLLASLLSVAGPSDFRKGGKTSRPRTPRSAPRSPKPMTPREGDPGARRPAFPRSPDRQLNVTDALSYLDAVKMQFQDKPDVYNEFLDIMKEFKSQVLDTPGVIQRVSALFHGNPYLIQGFNTFLPPGFRIEISENPRESDTITVTTPHGTITQKLNTYGMPTAIHEHHLAPQNLLAPYAQPPPFGPPPVLPIGIGSGSRPHTPHLPLIPPYGYADALVPSSPSTQGSQTHAAAFLGNMSNPSSEKASDQEFTRAIEFLNKIKLRYSDDAETYKGFLALLKAYQKEQWHLQDSHVYVQVQGLFKDAPDLMSEFKDFLPAEMNAPGPPPGFVGILPHPNAGPSTGAPGEGSGASAEKGATKTASRRRKRPADKEVPAPKPAAGSRAAKRTKPNQKPEPGSPKFSPYHAPSPPPAQMPLATHHAPQAHAHVLQPIPVLPGIPELGPGGQEEVILLERIKKQLEGAGTYDEFLKLLGLFARDIIDTKTLVERAEIFLDGELMAHFRELIGWDDKFGNVEHGPPGSIRTGPPDMWSAQVVDDGQGPSYRKLAESEVHLACSGRDQLCWSVLNDEWISHPTWASEESGFNAHKKNQYEEVIHRCEEERHEYHTWIDALQRTIAVLDPLEVRLEEMTPEERAAFRLGPDFGGESPRLYEKVIKRVYSKENGGEFMRALQECPAIAVPVVLARLKQRDEEWRRIRRDFNKMWRDIEHKNFYKSLDMQSVQFKANDKKHITAKHFVQEIETAKAAQLQAYSAAIQEGHVPVPGASVGYQFDFDFQDTGVLQDSLKLIYSFLDRNAVSYSVGERRGIERFLRQWVPVLFMIPPQEFNAACGPLAGGHDDDAGDETPPEDEHAGVREPEGGRQASGSTAVSAGELRRRLLKMAQERSPRTKSKDLASRSAVVTRAGSPVGDASASANKSRGSRLQQQWDSGDLPRTIPDDVWIAEVSSSAGEAPIKRRPFFSNTTFYTLLRLVQLLYSRLLTCKEVGAREVAEKYATLRPNPVAVELGLDDPSGPAAVLAQAVEALGESRSGEEPNVLYLYLLEALEKTFDNELDQVTFEEHMRWFFRTKAFHVFTIDKVITAIVKQVQTVIADHKCQELWELLQAARSEEILTTHDTIRYRREAERHAGSDDNLYKVDWEVQSKRLRIQLLDEGDPSVEDEVSAIGRWQEYLASYVLQHATEWMPATRRQSAAAFLKRTLMGGSETEPRTEREGGVRVVVAAGSYKLMYAAGSEESFIRRRAGGGETQLRTRATARAEERKRRLGRLLI